MYESGMFIKSMSSGLCKAGYCPWIAVWPRENFWTSLCLSCDEEIAALIMRPGFNGLVCVTVPDGNKRQLESMSPNRPNSILLE